MRCRVWIPCCQWGWAIYCISWYQEPTIIILWWVYNYHHVVITLLMVPPFFCIWSKISPDWISPSTRVQLMEVVGRVCVTSRSLRAWGVEAKLPTYGCRHGHWGQRNGSWYTLWCHEQASIQNVEWHYGNMSLWVCDRSNTSPQNPILSFPFPD